MSADTPARDRLAALVWAEVKTSGLRQCEVACEAGITEKHLNQMFHGKASMSWGMAERVLAAVGRRLVVGTEIVTEAPGG